MYSKEQLFKEINTKDLTSPNKMADCLKTWRIDPIYEDDDKNEYYDELAISKLRHAIKLKKQGKADEEISSIVNNGIIQPINAPAVKNATMTNSIKNSGTDLNKVTIDVTSQTLSLLAESIAEKITTEITDKIKQNDFLDPVMDSAKLTRDNEILSKQVEKLLEENKKLIARNNMLQKENAKFRHLFGNWYIKDK